ncbi:zinc/cadmium/mercury/lead-transporting ATPase [Siccibacter colletis]|uniref:zinc/cadmium/mercury/lead-transporting ATPase n=1 Tax=Siccibacter colletis TaxID=1505757 RepID=UPI003CEBB03A
MTIRPENGPAVPRFATLKMRPLNGAPAPEPQPKPEAGTTRYSWYIDGMDCPACARKVENALRQVAGIASARVAFASEKLTVDAQRDVRQAVSDAVTRIGFTLRDIDAAPAQPRTAWREQLPLLALAAMMAVSWLLTHSGATQAGQIAFIVTTLVGLWPIARQALRLMRSGNPFAIETLMSVAAIGALFIGATAEAAMVLLLFMIGERLESWAATRARRGVSALVALKPETATRLREGKRETVALVALRPGDVIEVAAGGRLPADGRLRSAFASFDESALTGESVPVERTRGESVAAGATSVDRLVELDVVSEPGHSAIDRILQLIEEAESRRAPIERFIERFSRVYTPLIMGVALLVAILPPLLFGLPWLEWIYKGLTLLLIGCPCALVISTPAAITSGLAAAARRGALIKGGAALEQLSRVRQVAFDKTGTLTQGTPQVTAIHAADGDENALLALAASVERGATHPLAQAILREALARGLTLSQATDQRTLAGSGIEAAVAGRRVLLSAPDKLVQALSPAWQKRIAEAEAIGQTVVAVIQNEQLVGTLALRDTLREDARQAIAALQRLGVKCVMLTGDNPRAAQAIAGELALDYRAGLLPADKVAAVNALNHDAPLAMVGDGINDAPAMKAASIGVAMGSGTDVALETADAALTHNRLTGLAEMMSLARATHANIRQNIAIALGLKGIFLVTTLAGMTGLWLAVLADTGATVLVTANALRLLRRGK